MILIFTNQDYHSNMFHDYDIGIVLEKYMLYKKVYIGKSGEDFKIFWNNFHKFYTLSLFEISGNGDKRGHWDEVLKVIKENNEIRNGPNNYTWRWEGKEHIPGIKVEILPK